MGLTGLIAANNLSDVTNTETTWNNIGNNLSATIHIPSPTLDLNFAANKSLIDDISGNSLITFDRVGIGTFVGSNGLIQTAASGVPRFEHNPSTGESLGLLIEEPRTNFYAYSNAFADAGVWLPSSGTAYTRTANAVISPDGTLNAAQITATELASIRQTPTTAESTAVRTLSFFAKAGTGSSFYVRFFSNTAPSSVEATFNLLTGTVSVNNSTVMSASIIPFGNGWYKCICCRTDSVLKQSPDIWLSLGSFFLYGAQLETGVSPTSYISTTGASLSRAADIATISGSNFSSWYNQTEGTALSISRNVYFGGALWSFGTSAPRWFSRFENATGVATQAYDGIGSAASVNVVVSGATTTSMLPSLRHIATINNTAQRQAATANGSNATVGNWDSISGVSSLQIGRRFDNSTYLNATISRLVYYPVSLTNASLKVLTVDTPASTFSYSFAIKGKDIFALNQISNIPTQSFVFVKGLTSKVQTRITTASQYTTSGVTSRDLAMPKIAPTTSGNYFFSSGLTLSGNTYRVNGANVLSVATSPFSGSSATTSLLLGGFNPQANWRITEPMVSGTISSPQSAIPIETGDFLLFMKAGQS
jgi:hypothetical protein